MNSSVDPQDASDSRNVDALVLGVDVGSTTVKTVAVDPATRQILWSRYERHETRQASTVEAQLAAMQRQFGNVPESRIRVFATGSGAAPLVEPLGAKFVQEVNAVTIAVDALHPDVGSVVELGGQDAKIIIYKPTREAGTRRVIASMNDKCASGTGATIDKCVTKVGLEVDALRAISWEPGKLHHVAAKCGVFAETDIVSLVKAGIPSVEIMCSLADAIVMQNLSVLTRGNTLQHRVLLLGGPNTYLPFLRGCWRRRIPEVWQARGYEYPRDVPIEELVFVPPHAELYAAYGAAIYGLQEQGEAGSFRGLEALRAAAGEGRRRKLAAMSGPPLVTSDAEREDFVRRYTVPAFSAATLPPGEMQRGYIGIDGGSTSSKAVLLDEGGRVLFKHYQLSQGNPIADAKEIFARIKAFAAEQGCSLEVRGVGATGYAADILEDTIGTDANIVETVAHMMAATAYFDDVDVVCDVGGQDIKVLSIAKGQLRNFRLSNQCSAGNGMMLQAMASQFGVPMHRYADTAFRAELTPKFNYGCAVFLDTDRVTFQKEGYTKEELLAGLALVLPKNIWQYVVQIPRLAQLGSVFVLQGGTQYNLAAVKAQHDYIMERVPGATIYVHPHCGEAGAIGAGLEAKRAVERRGRTAFIGLDAAIGLLFTARNDDSTVCRFCPNECKRTYIDTVTPQGRSSRYISGFSCENGTVESKEALKKVALHRKALKGQFPNLVEYEAQLAFKHFFEPAPLPAPDALVDDVRRGRSWFGKLRRAGPARAFERSPHAAAERRSRTRIGMPRVLNMYSTAPLWRTYFETLGIDPRNVVYSDFTSEEMWAAGGRYGSIDPCFPSKVAQAHIHDLLFDKHTKAPLDYIFFPCLTHLPSFVEGMPDATACPIVAGAPKVVRAAFTKEIDFFARAGVEYVDPAVTLTERHYFRQQMHDTWCTRLGITRDESDFAVDQAFEALRQFDGEMQHRGSLLLAQLEQDCKVGILVLGRPYHDDPGLNHDVLDEFQALGYPVLSIRSIPKDPHWLRRFFSSPESDVRPLSIADVWPEAYSTNSAEKVWAAKFAARHPNLVVLDFSSFKCGHDAPTYGMIDSIISASGTPYSALHDIDANKPTGSIKIRIRTYEHALKRRAEVLQDRAARQTELERLVEARRRELYRLRQAALSALIESDPRARRQRGAMEDAYAQYLAGEAPIKLKPIEPKNDRACESSVAENVIVVQWPAARARDAAAKRTALGGSG